MDPLKELKAEVKNFLIGIRYDLHKVALSVWTPEQFAVRVGLKIEKMEKFLEEIENDS